MRAPLKSLVAVFALIFAAGPMARALDFYATNNNNNIYGVNIDGTVTLIGSTGVSPLFGALYDIATDPVTQSVYILGYQVANITDPFPGKLYSATIGANSVSTSLIGQIASDSFIEGGLAFSSFQGTNQLYATGLVGIPINAGGNGFKPTLFSLNQLTGAGTVINSNLSINGPDMNSLFSAPDGTLWSLAGRNGTGSNADLFRFASNGTIDKSIVVTGMEDPSVGGVTVKNGVTYYLSSPRGKSYSTLGTLTWDSVNNTYTGGFNVITNSIVSGMTGLTVAPNSVAVPEPSTYALAAIATGVMAAIARRRKARKA